jgi:hypothetical protein
MISKGLVTGLALVLLIAGGVTFAAQGGGGPGASKGPQSRSMQQETERAAHRKQNREQAPEAGKQVRAQKEKTERKTKADQGRGEQTAAEMQERRTERKEIQETYRSGGETAEPKAKKKPWWNFWGDDQS